MKVQQKSALWTSSVGVQSGAIGVVFVSAAIIVGLPAFIKMGIGLLIMMMAGRAFNSLLDIDSPKMFGLSYDICMGQLALLLYIYGRSAVSACIGWGYLGQAEVFSLVGGMALVAQVKNGRSKSRKVGAQNRGHERHKRSAISYFEEIALTGLPASGLCYLLKDNLSLLYLPSSDPELHAYMLKHMLDAGRLLTGTFARSDVPINYTTGFAALNFAWARVTGLPPATVVQVMPYLQYFLCGGISFAAMSRLPIPLYARLTSAMLVMGAFPYLISPVFFPAHASLEGTARLSHTALLIFPMVFLLVNRQQHGQGRPKAVWLVLALTIAHGMTINPAHALYSAVVAASAAICLKPCTVSISMRRAGVAAAIIGAICFFIATQDAYYRTSILQPIFDKSAPKAQLVGTEDGFVQPSLFRRHGRKQALRDAARWVKPSSLYAIPGMAIREQVMLKRFLLLGVLLFVLIYARTGVRHPWTRVWYRQLLYAAGLCSLAQILVLLAISTVIDEQNRSGWLLRNYSLHANNQVLLLLYPMLACLPLLQRPQKGHSNSIWRKHLYPATASTFMCLLAVYITTDSQIAQHRARSRNALTETPFGKVTEADLDLVYWAQKNIPKNERVLLPGSVLKLSHGEQWVFPSTTGRALGMYSDVATAFYFGVDGQSFSPQSYSQHFETQVDTTWLRAHNILWLTTGETLNPAVLERYYKLAYDGGSKIYRLKDDSLYPAATPGNRSRCYAARDLRIAFSPIPKHWAGTQSGHVDTVQLTGSVLRLTGWVPSPPQKSQTFYVTVNHRVRRATIDLVPRPDVADALHDPTQICSGFTLDIELAMPLPSKQVPHVCVVTASDDEQQRPVLLSNALDTNGQCGAIMALDTQL